MLEIIYGILSWVAIAFTGYTIWYGFRHMKDLPLEKIPIKVIDSMVNKYMANGIAFVVSIVLSVYLSKDSIIIMANVVGASFCLRGARNYLKASSLLKEMNKKK